MLDLRKDSRCTTRHLLWATICRQSSRCHFRAMPRFSRRSLSRLIRRRKECLYRPRFRLRPKGRFRQRNRRPWHPGMLRLRLPSSRCLQQPSAEEPRSPHQRSAAEPRQYGSRWHRNGWQVPGIPPRRGPNRSRPRLAKLRGNRRRRTWRLTCLSLTILRRPLRCFPSRGWRRIRRAHPLIRRRKPPPERRPRPRAARRMQWRSSCNRMNSAG